MLDPNFCGEENLFAGNTRFCDCVSYFLFVEVTLSRIDMSIADFQSIENAAFAFFLVHLINSVTEFRHFHAVR